MGPRSSALHTLAWVYLLVLSCSTAFNVNSRVARTGCGARRPCSTGNRLMISRKSDRVSHVARVAQEASAASDCSPATDMMMEGRHVTIVTTAALPWMTGTSINPLLRALYLSQAGVNVTLAVPWLNPHEGDQQTVFPGYHFSTPGEQSAMVRNWARSIVDDAVVDGLAITWYPARYHPNLGCILFDRRQGQIFDHLGHDDDRDIAILEEPEHLNWYHWGDRWSDHFNHVVGIAHTNYMEYSRNDVGGWYKAPFQHFFSALVFRAYCDVIIQLSATLADSGAPREISKVCNVHGVRERFIDIGRKRATGEQDGRGVYFLGKKLWAKGYRELLDLLKSSTVRDTHLKFPCLHLYGSGPDEDAIHQECFDMGLDVQLHPAIDHADEHMHGYHVFVNPSTSDVLCTATAEALAMGKTVVISDHPSNEFFKQFKNCKTFSDEESFLRAVTEASATAPLPLDETEMHLLGWAAATQRLFEMVKMPVGAPRPSKSLLATLHYTLHMMIGYGVVGMVVRDLTGTIPEIEPAKWLRQQSDVLLNAFARPNQDLGTQLRFSSAFATIVASLVIGVLSPMSLPRPSEFASKLPERAPVVLAKLKERTPVHFVRESCDLSCDDAIFGVQRPQLRSTIRLPSVPTSIPDFSYSIRDRLPPRFRSLPFNLDGASIGEAS